jgi:hypothetical protein
MEVTKNVIKKATIKNDRCSVQFNETAGSEINAVNKDCGGIIHKDLLAAMNRLRVHLVTLTEQPEAKLVTQDSINDFDLTLLDNYTITGYTIGGSDEHEGVTITGQKLLKLGRVLNLVSPFIKYEDEYEFQEELGQDVEMVTYEVKEYLLNGKFGIKQESLDFDAPQEADIELSNAAQGIATMTVSSGRRSKKLKVTAQAV